MLQPQDKPQVILELAVRNHPGVMSHVCGLFARRAFNEFWSFFTAWAQMLNYVITIAISAFYAAHYAGGVFWDTLTESPGR